MLTLALVCFVLCLFGYALDLKVRFYRTPVGPLLFATRTRDRVHVFAFGLWAQWWAPLHPLLKAEQRMAGRIVTMLLVALMAGGVASAQTPCDGQVPSDPFVVQPGGSGVPVYVAYPTADFSQVTKAVVQVIEAGTPTQVYVTQDVAKTAMMLVGTMTSMPTMSCYRLPDIPPATLPKGENLALLILMAAQVPTYNSAQSAESRPFGQSLPSPVVVIK